MHRRAGRFVPALGAALVALLIGAGSLALASGDQGHGQQSHHAYDGHGKRGHSGDRSGKRCGHKCYSAWDEEWLMMSIEGDRFEIAGGQLAQQKAASSGVREFGARLVRDHTKSLQDAVEVAQKLGIEVPDSPSPSQQWELRAVAQFSGSEFDRWYSDLEVQDHMQDIQEAQDEVEKGCNRKVRQLAKDDLPVLQQHLEIAQSLLSASGG